MRDRRTLAELTAPLLLALILISFWSFLTGPGGIPHYFLPSPGAVAKRLVSDLITGHIWLPALTTMYEAALGALLGGAVALPLAYIIHRSHTMAAAISPFLGATQAIPAIALAPLLALWLGYGTFPIVVLCAVLVFFPILVSTNTGFKHLDKAIVEAARIDGAAGLTLLRHIEVPMAMPAILSGIRNGFTLSVTGAVIGEMVMGGTGLGMTLTTQRNSVDMAGLFVTIFLLCLMASAVYVALREVERHSKIVQSLGDANR